MADVPGAETTAGSTAGSDAGSDSGVDAAKRLLRPRMRQLRRALTDRPERSAVLWAALLRRDDVHAASRVMVFESIPTKSEEHFLPLAEINTPHPA